MEIREIGENDFSAFSRMMESFYYYAGNEQPSAEGMRMLMDKAINPEINLVFIGAFEDRKLAGILSLTYAESSYRVMPFVWCDDLFVDPSFRGKGVGSLLIEGAKKRAGARGCSNILLGVGMEDGNAQQFYTSLGFRDMKNKLMTLPL